MKPSIEPNDPRLTAYALGEMPLEEQAAFELLLQVDPAAQNAVREIRGAAEILIDALDQEPAPARVIEPPAAYSARRRARWSIPWTIWIPLGAVAAFAFYYNAANRPGSSSPEVVTATPSASQSAAVQTNPTAVATTTPPGPIVPGTVATTPVAPVPEPTVVADAPAAPAPGKVFPKVEFLPPENIGLFPTPRYELHDPSAAGTEPSSVQLAGVGNRAPFSANSDRNTATLGRASTPLNYEANNAEKTGPRRRTILPGRALPGAHRSPQAKRTDLPAANPPALGDATNKPGTPGVLTGEPAPWSFVPSAVHASTRLSPEVGNGTMALVTASVRAGELPAPEDVWVEEMLNYFPAPARPHQGNAAAQVRTELHPAPWAPERLLLRIAVRPVALAETERRAVNLVFLVDTSSAMYRDGGLTLVRDMIARLALRLEPRDRLAIIAYGDTGGVVLPSTSVDHPTKIHEALGRLGARSDARGGLRLPQAYEAARAGFLADGLNRVVWCSAGDPSIEFTNPNELRRFLGAQASSGIGFAALTLGNPAAAVDAAREIAAAAGGEAVRLETPAQARRWIVEQFAGTFDRERQLGPIVVEFNPTVVASHRLLGFDGNANANANAAGETPLRSVTALFEIVPAANPPANAASVWGRVRVPTRDSRDAAPVMIETGIGAPRTADDRSVDFQFSAGVSGFGLLLADAPDRGALDWKLVEQLTRAGLGNDDGGHRADFLALVQRARKLSVQK